MGRGLGASYTTTNDLATFWMELAEGQVLGPSETTTVMEWAEVARPGEGEMLLSRLPPGTDISFKTGWRDLVGARISGGVITAPDGSRLAVAIALLAPSDTFSDGSLRWASYGACLATYAVMETAHTCGRSGDPATLTATETGPLWPDPPRRQHQPPWVI